MPGEFQLTGSASQLIADGADFGTAEDLAALAGIVIKFTSNIPINKAVPIPGGVMYVPPRTATILASGQISEDGVNPGITLLADDPALELTAPLQWTIDPGRAILAGKTVKLAKWTFNAPAPGDDQTLDELTPVPGITQPGGTRGPRGYPVDDVELVSGTGALNLTLSVSGDDVTASVSTTGSDTIQFSAHSLPVGGPLPVLVAGIGPRIVADPVQYSAVGDGTTDDTAALQAALADLVDGGVLWLPYGKTFKYTGTLTIPDGVTVMGSRVDAIDPANLLAGHANAVIQYGSYVHFMNLKIDGNNVANWGLQSTGPINKPAFSSVLVMNFLQVAYVFESVQNAVLIDCSAKDSHVGYYIVNGCCNLEFIGCAVDNTIMTADTTHRSIVIDNSTDARLVGTVFVGGNRDIRFWGGIYEYGAGQYTVDILQGNATDPGNIQFTGTQLCGSSGATALVHVGSGWTGGVVLRDTVCAMNSATSKLVNAASGSVKLNNVTALGTGGRALTNLVTLTGTGAVSYDADSAQVIPATDSTFLAGKGLWQDQAPGSATWSSTKRRLVVASTATTNGAFVYPSVATYFRQYGVVRLRFSIFNATNPVRVATFGSGPQRTVPGSPFTNGFYDVGVDLQGDEQGFIVTANSAVSTSAEFGYFKPEHVV